MACEPKADRHTWLLHLAATRSDSFWFDRWESIDSITVRGKRLELTPSDLRQRGMESPTPLVVDLKPLLAR